MKRLILSSFTLVLATLFVPAATQADELKSKGSIPLAGVSRRDYHQAAKVNLTDAVNAAMQKQPGKAVSAELEGEDGYLIYEVTIVSAEGKKTEVYVDAGNKSILGTEKG